MCSPSRLCLSRRIFRHVAVFLLLAGVQVCFVGAGQSVVATPAQGTPAIPPAPPVRVRLACLHPANAMPAATARPAAVHAIVLLHVDVRMVAIQRVSLTTRLHRPIPTRSGRRWAGVVMSGGARRWSRRARASSQPSANRPVRPQRASLPRAVYPRMSRAACRQHYQCVKRGLNERWDPIGDLTEQERRFCLVR